MEKKTKKAGRNKGMLTTIAPLMTVAFILGAWEAVILIWDVPSYYVPRMTDAVKTLWNNFPSMWPNVFFTIKEIVFGYLIGAFSGIALAFLFTSSRALDRAINPYVMVLKVIPLLILVPFLMILFGFGIGVKILAVALSTFPVVLLNAETGIHNVDPARYELMRSLRATKFQTFTQVLVPSILPHIFTGLKLGCIFATTGAIGAEFAGSGIGIAPMIYANISFSKMDFVFAYIIVLAIIGCGLYMLVSFAESRLITWKS